MGMTIDKTVKNKVTVNVATQGKKIKTDTKAGKKERKKKNQYLRKQQDNMQTNKC